MNVTVETAFDPIFCCPPNAAPGEVTSTKKESAIQIMGIAILPIESSFVGSIPVRI